MTTDGSHGGDLPGHYAGVPLGGVGAGCIELGEDGRFRNVTINNNRTAATRIPMAPGAFVAVRVSKGPASIARILQPDSSVAFSKAGIEGPYTPSSELSWYGLYPASNFQLRSKEFPVEIQWSCLAPIIPYDTEASTLPLVLSVVQFRNASDEPVSVSAMMNWENLRGCSGDEAPEDRGRIDPLVYTTLDEKLHTGPPDESIYDETPTPLGLAFGLDEPCLTNSEGNYCLLGVPLDASLISYASWRMDDAEDVRELWQAFAERGNLSNTIKAPGEAYGGAICQSSNLAPGASLRMAFALTWYCPVYVVDDEDLGNHYAREYESSVEVASYALKHADYFLRAVTNWQQRFSQSSLPKWYARMLINNCHVLTTNSLLTKNGDFALMETPRDPVTGVLDRSFYASIGTLLFFPGFAERELELYGRTETEEQPGRVYRELGKGTVTKPGYGPGRDEMVELNAKFVLLAYRNFHLTGNKVALMHLFPRLKLAMEHGVRLSRDGSGIPEARGDATTFRGWAVYGLNAYAGGLWIAAMQAYSRLARQMKRDDEADLYRARAKAALQRFEQGLWNDREGYYRLYNDKHSEESGHPSLDDACQSAQLAGPWIADFLHLDVPFASDRVGKALAAVCKLNRRDGGFVKGSNPDGSPCVNPASFPEKAQTDQCWPFHTATYVACSMIAHGKAEEGLKTLHSIYETIHIKHQRTFNQPLSWDADRDEASGWKQDRHMGAPSIWYSYFAMLGFFMSVSEERIVLAPRLPDEVDSLSVPLFTPLSFGWLKYRERAEPEYRQQIHITFESPIFVRVVELATPRSLRLPRVKLSINEEPASIETQLVPGARRNRLILTLEAPVQLQQPIEILVK